MEMSEVNCTNCGKHMVVERSHVRENMFCTIGCMVRFEEKKK